jgi:hypothetical protein
MVTRSPFDKDLETLAIALLTPLLSARGSPTGLLVIKVKDA